MRYQKINVIKLILSGIAMLFFLSGCSTGESFTATLNSTSIVAGELVEVGWTAQPAENPLDIFTASAFVSLDIYRDGIRLYDLDRPALRGTYSFTPKQTGTYQLVAHFNYYDRFQFCWTEECTGSQLKRTGQQSYSTPINVDIDIPVTAELIPDPKLYQCIADTNPQFISSVTTLDCSQQGIQSINGLDYFSNLESLDLTDNPISTTSALEPIQHLANLNYLNLLGITADCYSVQEYQLQRGSELTIETDCPAIQLISEVNFDDPTMKNQCQFKNNRSYTTGYVHRVGEIHCTSDTAAELISLTDLARFYNLERLSIVNDSNSCLDLTDITEPSGILTLTLDGCFDHYELLQNFIALNYLSLKRFPETDIAFVTSMPNLSYLTIQGSPGLDTSPIASRTKLRELNLAQNELDSLADFSTFSSLETVYLNDNLFDDITVLISALPRLDYLNLNDNQLSDITGIDSLAQADGTIRLQNNNITSGWLSLLNSYWSFISLKGNDNISCEQLADLDAAKYLYSKPDTCIQ